MPPVCTYYIKKSQRRIAAIVAGQEDSDDDDLGPRPHTATVGKVDRGEPEASHLRLNVTFDFPGSSSKIRVRIGGAVADFGVQVCLVPEAYLVGKPEVCFERDHRPSQGR